MRRASACNVIVDGEVVARRCSGCHQTLPTDSFYVHRPNNGWQTKCKTCNKASVNARYDARAKRCQALRRTYGISAVEFDQMAEERGWACDACGEVPPSDQKPSRLVVDHHHISGKNRGLLCHGCNTALGLLLESPDRIRHLADYVERWHPTEGS